MLGNGDRDLGAVELEETCATLGCGGADEGRERERSEVGVLSSIADERFVVFADACKACI